MKKYSYRIVNKKTGKISENEIFARGPEEAQQKISSDAVIILELGEMDQSLFYTDISYFFSVRAENLSRFFNQLAILLKAHIQIHTALAIVIKTAGSRRWKDILEIILHEVSSGSSLSAAFKNFPHVFSDFIISATGIGEKTGRLSEVMMEISADLKKNTELKRKFVSAMIYPAVLTGFSLLVMLIMFIFVFPSISSIFETENITLPLLTRMLFSAGNFLKNHILPLSLFAVFFLIMIKFFHVGIYIKKNLDRFLIVVPRVNSLFYMKELYFFTNSFYLLIKNRIQILEAIQICVNGVTNDFIRERMGSLYADVEQGNTLAVSIEKINFFSELFLEMIRTGELSGDLETVFKDISEYYYTQYETTLARFLEIIGPVFIILVGILYAVLIFSIYVPILSLWENM
ncbi:MAG TPA: hypothetical protein DC049_05455 [Spirochaetia bacterium]|nr:hypothetical protein [Spirochaetia bacterium]